MALRRGRDPGRRLRGRSSVGGGGSPEGRLGPRPQSPLLRCWAWSVRAIRGTCSGARRRRCLKRAPRRGLQRTEPPGQSHLRRLCPRKHRDCPPRVQRHVSIVRQPNGAVLELAVASHVVSPVPSQRASPPNGKFEKAASELAIAVIDLGTGRGELRWRWSRRDCFLAVFAEWCYDLVGCDQTRGSIDSSRIFRLSLTIVICCMFGDDVL